MDCEILHHLSPSCCPRGLGYLLLKPAAGPGGCWTEARGEGPPDLGLPSSPVAMHRQLLEARASSRQSLSKESWQLSQAVCQHSREQIISN
jgi:hypothetical protein